MLKLIAALSLVTLVRAIMAADAQTDGTSKFCDPNKSERDEFGVLKECWVIPPDPATPPDDYIITANKIFLLSDMECTPSLTTLCCLTFNTAGEVTFTSSTIKASLIKFIGNPSSFYMDSGSRINVTGKGNIQGAGFSSKSGASYGGQGGSNEKIDYTYGTFNQIPDGTTNNIAQMGSGGNDDTLRGGGVVIINARQATINGKIEANGIPTANKIGQTYNAGSGGYIYIKCTDKPCTITGNLYAEGGLGSDDQSSNSGSGGRIVLDNVIISSDKYSVSGGCSNFNIKTYFNGAGGTVFFVQENTLIVKNSLRCFSNCITPLDPTGIQTVKNILITQASFSLKVDSTITTKIINATISNMIMDNLSEFDTPLQSNDADAIFLNIANFTMNNSTIKNSAINITILSDNINLTDSSVVKYHSKFELYGSKSMLLNGTIMQNEYVANDGLLGTVNIYAGDPFNIDSTYHNGTILRVGNSSKILAQQIMILSDQNILIEGNIRNEAEDKNGVVKVLGSCLRGDSAPNIDVFRCVPINKLQKLYRWPYQLFESNQLNNYKIINAYNSQFNTGYSQMYQVFEKMPKNFTIYIQSLGIIQIDGMVKGAKISLCSTNLNITGSVNATGGGCTTQLFNNTSLTHPCCNFGGGSYGGRGYMGSKTLAVAPNCDQDTKDKTDCNQVTVGPIYGQKDYFAYSGSAGGGDLSGKGGGIIWINVENRLKLDGYIESDGTDSESPPGADKNSGGGSGGAISITAYVAETTSEAYLSVQGGNGNYGGGFGGGGWIYGYMIDSLNDDKFPDASTSWNPVVITNPGKPNTTSSDLYWKQENFGVTSHPPCLMGYENLLCSPCISGFYKNDNTSADCIQCTNKPSRNSYYIREPGEQKDQNCPYSCFSSVPNVEKNPNCYNSFNWFIEKLGGWVVVTVLLSVISVGIFCLWLYLKIKSNRRAKDRAKYSFNNLELNDKRKILEDHEFTTADLPFQICRAYFRGTNTASNQWTIPLEPPMKLKNIVFISSYEDFTTNLNNIAKWSKKEKIWYYLLMVIYPAFLPIYVRTIRKKKFKKLRNEINTVQKSIWLNSEERRTQLVTKTIKLSSSRDYTMAYLDFLDLDKDREFYNGPVLPLTFHLSGDGNFNSPFYINKRDCLVRSLSLLDRSENFIDIYLENLNSYLQSLSFYEFLSLSESKFWGLIRFLHSNNKGTLRKRSIKAELAILEYINKGNKTVRLKKSSQLNSMNECSQTYIFHFDFINKYPQTVRNIVDYCRYELFKGKKDIKLAIIFSRLDQSTLIPKANAMDINAISPRSGYMSVHLNEKYNRSSARHTKVSSPHFYESAEENKEHTSEDSSENKPFGGILNNFKTNWAEPLIMKDKSDTQFNQSDKNSFSATGSVYSNASYAPNKIEVQSIEDNEQLADLMVEENPLIAFKNRRHGRDFCFRVKIFFVAFYKLAFMRNSLPPLYPMVNLCIMVILLFLDIFASLMLTLLYMHEKKLQYPIIPFVFVYPFTIILSPLIGVTSVFICKASFYRIFLNMNALTCTANIFLSLLTECVIVFLIGDEAKGQIRSTESIEPLIILILKIGFNILICYFGCKQLAFNDNNTFYINKQILDKMSAKPKVPEIDCVSDYFKPTENNTNSFTESK